MLRWVGFIIGLLIVGGSFTAGRTARRRLFQCWHDAEPREWAAVAHQLRRRWPFSALVAGRIYHVYDDKWRRSMPNWLRNSPDARKWLWKARLSNALVGLGLIAMSIALFS
jgi:hypothetical protein